MVKADPKRNYYADLEVSPSATQEDIKSAFRRLAKLYHPDRNPGNEAEYVPKFQAIQAAHEILGDPQQRARYDGDRRKLGYNRPTYTSRPPNRPSPNIFTQNAQNSPRAPQPPNPNASYAQSSRTWSSQTQGQSAYAAFEADRRTGPSGPPRNFTNFKPPPRPAPTAARPDLDGRAKAWKHFRGGSNPTNTSPPKTPEARGTSRADQRPPQPGLGRSFTTRVPRRQQFDPNAPGELFEPAAPRSSSYIFVKERANSHDNLYRNREHPLHDPEELEELDETGEKYAKPHMSNPTSPSSVSTGSSSGTGGIALDDTGPQLPPRHRETPDSSRRTPVGGSGFRPDVWEGKFSAAPLFHPTPSDSFRKSAGSRQRMSPSRKQPFPPPPATAASTASTSNSDANSTYPEPPESQNASNFEGEKWKTTFKDSSFVFSPTKPTSASAASTSQPTTKTRSTTSRSSESFGRVTSNSGTYGASISSDQSDDSSVEGEADAMDIDTPPKTHTPEGSKVRPVRQPISRRDWGATKPMTSAPSEIPLSADNIPTAVPNAPPPPSSASPRSPMPPAPPSVVSPSKLHHPKPRRASTRVEQSNSAAFNLSDMQQNLGRSGEGVSNMADLKDSLPFDSRPSAQHPSVLLSNSSGHASADLPKGPPLPVPPSLRQLTPAKWKGYLQQFSVYMGLWYQYEDRILTHFMSRHHDARKFGTGGPDVNATRLLEAQGEPAGGGLGTYLENYQQNQKLQVWWMAAQVKHHQCVQDFVKVKERIQTDGFAKG